jgi:hypothetical protein
MSPLYPPPVAAPAASAAMSRLGSTRFSGSSQTSSVVTIPSGWEVLNIYFNVTGYSGSGIASLRFNGDSTASHYSSSYFIGTSTTKTNSLATFAGAKLGQNAVTVERNGQIVIYNLNDTNHLWVCTSTTQASASTAPVTSCGSGNWVSTSATYITSIQMVVDTSGITMPAGTGFVVYGDTP